MCAKIHYKATEIFRNIDQYSEKFLWLYSEFIAAKHPNHSFKKPSKAILIGAVPPIMLKTALNPGGLPIETFDKIRAGVLADRSQFFKDLSGPFYELIVLVLRFHKAYKIFLGCRGRLAVLRGFTITSKPFLKQISQKILRSSIFQP